MHGVVVYQLFSGLARTGIGMKVPRRVISCQLRDDSRRRCSSVVNTLLVSPDVGVPYERWLSLLTVKTWGFAGNCYIVKYIVEKLSYHDF